MDGGYELIGYRRDDPDLPTDESRIFWPDSAQMVPELADLHIADLGDYLGQRRRTPGTTTRPEARVILTARDFYVIDGHEVVLMRYAEDGTYLGAVGAGASSTQGYTALAELAWEMSAPFTDWWASHPQYHRASCAA